MALQKTIDVDGAVHSDAYHVVSSIIYSKEDEYIVCRVSSFKDKESKDSSPKECLTSFIYEFKATGSFNPVDSNMSTLCYSYLKSLPAWSGAIDV